MFKLSRRSLGRLEGVHPDLVAIPKEAIRITPYDFGIIEGVRTPAVHARNLANGRSTVKYSLHLPQPDGYSHAFDFYVLDSKGKYVHETTHQDVHGYYRKVMQSFVTVAIANGTQIELGGLWRHFLDSMHVQLNQKYYQKRV